MAKRKKGEQHRDLGQKVWDERLDVLGAEKITATLAKLMESKASRLDELKKEINEWEKNKVRVQEKIEKIEKRTIPLFENLGVLADQTRLEQKTLLLNYSQIDRNKKRITGIEQQLKDLE